MSINKKNVSSRLVIYDTPISKSLGSLDLSKRDDLVDREKYITDVIRRSAYIRNIIF